MSCQMRLLFATVLKTCKIVVWNECTMANKKPPEALDRTLQDLRGQETEMGGALLLLVGDFRQTLPVIPADELSTNMGVRLQGADVSREFSQQLLKNGDRTFMNTPGNHSVTFPDNFCNLAESINDVVNSVSQDIGTNYVNH